MEFAQVAYGFAAVLYVGLTAGMQEGLAGRRVVADSFVKAQLVKQ